MVPEARGKSLESEEEPFSLVCRVNPASLSSEKFQLKNEA